MLDLNIVQVFHEFLHIFMTTEITENREVAMKYSNILESNMIKKKKYHYEQNLEVYILECKIRNKVVE